MTLFDAFHIVIKVNLAAEDFKPKGKLYERVKWCFEHTMTGTYDFWISSCDPVSGETLEIQFPTTIGVQRHQNSFSTHVQKDILVPDLSDFPPLSFGTGSGTDDAREKALEILEWVGAASCGIDRISAADRVDPFISVYAAPEPSEAGDIFSAEWKGFISSKHVVSLVQGVRYLKKE
ncbi:hypothetical protein HK104_002619 [Borealophlyctis nickersoniae]|nr:hypothetical protein HK104_002619 [Borealophlyctis nickersoniae]